MAALKQKLGETLNVLDFVSGSRSARSRTTSASSTSYYDSVTSKLNNEIRAIDARNANESLQSVHLRLNPMLGRTLSIEPSSSFDLQSAFRSLEMRCSQNRVKDDFRVQRFHVRRGQAKKELKSKRWRALFKEGFLREVGRVRRMKGQGW